MGLLGTNTVIMSCPVDRRQRPQPRAGHQADGPDALLVRLDGDDGAALELLGPLAEQEVGDLLHGGVDRADQRHLHHPHLGQPPRRPADQVPDEHPDDVYQQNGQRHAQQARAEVVGVELCRPMYPNWAYGESVPLVDRCSRAPILMA